MKIKCQGISFKNNYNNIDFDYIFDYLENNQIVIEHSNFERYFFFFKDKKKPDEYCGLVLTFKNQKKDCRARVDKGKFKLNIEDLKDQKLATFNFFILKKTKLNEVKGIFLYYHSSCSAMSLSDYIRSSINKHMGSKKKNELKKAKTTKEIKEIKREYSGSINFSIITEDSKLVDLLKNLDEINKIEMSLEAKAYKDSDFAPITPYTKTAKLSFGIDKSVSKQTNSIISVLNDFIKNRDNYKKGKVVGIDKNGNERFFDFLNCPTFFSEFDYDILSENVNNLDETNYKKNKIYTIIRDEIDTYKKHFE